MPPRYQKFAGSGSVVTVSFRPVSLLPFRVGSEAKIAGFAMNHFFEDAHSGAIQELASSA
jgi:hypothetical protein